MQIYQPSMAPCYLIRLPSSVSPASSTICTRLSYARSEGEGLDVPLNPLEVSSSPSFRKYLLAWTRYYSTNNSRQAQFLILLHPMCGSPLQTSNMIVVFVERETGG